MEAIRLQRFKGFLDSDWIELKPITLLFGYNSSGKSSIINCLLMLKQSTENRGEDFQLSFSSKEGVDLGSYKDSVLDHKINVNEPMVISMRLNFTSRDFYHFGRKEQEYREYIKQLEQIDYSLSIGYNRKRRTNEILGFCIRDKNNKNVFSMHKKKLGVNAVEYFSSDYFDDVEGERFHIYWLGITPYLLERRKENWELQGILQAMNSRINSVFKNFANIGPVRSIPERTQFFTGIRPESVGRTGEDALQLVYVNKYSREKTKLEEKLNEWLKKYNYKFEWKILSPNLGQFILKDLRTGLDISIRDVGFGISQVLPVVIQILSLGPGSMLLIEQPEIHLHARAQSEIGDLLLQAVESENMEKKYRGYLPKKKIIVETHSEHILLRIRRRIAEQLKNKSGDKQLHNKIAIYFVENNKGYSEIHKIKLNERGNFESVPDSFRKFFTDDFEEILKMNEAMEDIPE